MSSVTGAAGFVGSHLLELLERERHAHRRLAAARHRAAGPRHARHAGSTSRCTIARPSRARSPSRAVSRSITSPASPHVGESWEHTHETFAGNVLATHHLFDALRRAALRAARPDHQLGVRLRAARIAPITEARPGPPEQPVRHQQGRAGDAGDARVGRRWDSGADRAIVQSHRAAAGAVVRRVEHREADRADRSRPARRRRC